MINRNIYIIIISLFFLISCNNKTINTGKGLYIKHACHACHSLDGTLKFGPTMKNQYGKEILHTNGTVMIIDDEYMRESIIFPLKHIVDGYTPIMPSYKPVLSDEDIANLAAYFASLK